MHIWSRSYSYELFWYLRSPENAIYSAVFGDECAREKTN